MKPKRLRILGWSILGIGAAALLYWLWHEPDFTEDLPPGVRYKHVRYDFTVGRVVALVLVFGTALGLLAARARRPRKHPRLPLRQRLLIRRHRRNSDP